MQYTIGFALSLALTIVAYLLAMYHPNHSWILVLLGALAIAQLGVQLTYFLHLGEEVSPRYKQASFWFMSTALIIVVVGSIWIMQNLNYNMMNFTPQQKTEYMLKQYDKGF